MRYKNGHDRISAFKGFSVPSRRTIIVQLFELFEKGNKRE